MSESCPQPPEPCCYPLQPSGSRPRKTGLIGTVTDSNGGALPGATVLAVNVGTQTTLAGVTNEAGVYQFNAVPLGSYELTITLQGFQTFKATNIVVAGTRLSARMPPWSVATSETIHRRGVQTDHPADRATVSQTIEARAVTDLPMPGRTSGDRPARRRPACSSGEYDTTSVCRSTAPVSARSRTA